MRQMLFLLGLLLFGNSLCTRAAESGCNDLKKQIPLGQAGDFKIFAQETVGYEPDENGKCSDEAAVVDAMDNIDLVAQSQKKRVVETVVEVPSGYGSGDHSVSLVGASRKGDKFIVRYGEDSRWLDEGTVVTVTYVWNAKTKKFRQIGEDQTSPAAKAQDKMLAAVKAGKIAQVKKMIVSGEIETSPNGNTVIAASLANSIAEAAWKPMMDAYRKKNEAKVKEWLDFFGQTYRGGDTCPFGFGSECYQGLWTDDAPALKSQAAIYNDFAFLLAANGDHATAEVVYREVLAHDPARTVAYLNLADLLWGKGAKEEAGFYYRVYLQRMLALDTKGLVTAEVKERAATPTKESKWSEAEAAKLAGVEKLTIGGKPWLNFKSFAAIPAGFLEFRKRDPDLSEVQWCRVKGEWALWGIPLRKDSDLSINSRTNLMSGTTGADFERNGLVFMGNKPFTTWETGIQVATLAKDGDAGSLKLKGGTSVEYDSSRPGPVEFTLRENQKIGMFTVAKDTLVRLTWGTFTLGEGLTLRGIELPSGTFVKVHYPSAVETFAPANPENVSARLPEARVFGPGFKARFIEFDKTGHIEIAQLAEKLPVAGKDCAAGGSVRWVKEEARYECRPDLNNVYWSGLAE